jgi:hypothetical protein
VGLSAVRAAAARHALVLDDLAIKVVLGLDNAAKEHPAIHAGVGALEAGVVRLYGIVVILSGWVRVGCARLFGVHSLHPFCGPGSEVLLHLRGHSFIRRAYYTGLPTVYNKLY